MKHVIIPAVHGGFSLSIKQNHTVLPLGPHHSWWSSPIRAWDTGAAECQHRFLQLYYLDGMQSSDNYSSNFCVFWNTAEFLEVSRRTLKTQKACHNLLRKKHPHGPTFYIRCDIAWLLPDQANRRLHVGLGKPAWWLAPAKTYRKQKGMYCSSPDPCAERTQFTGGMGGATQANCDG